MSQHRYYYGTLSRMNEIRSYPELGDHLVGNRPKGRLLQLKDQRISVLIEPRINNASLNLILSYYVSRFYSLPGHHDIERNRLAASLAGIVANCSDWGSLKPWTRMINRFKQAGINLIIDEQTVTA